jgi:hypothetical protein
MKSENKTIKLLLSMVAILLVLNLGFGLLHEKTAGAASPPAKTGKPVEYSWAISATIAAFSTDNSDVTDGMVKFVESLNSTAKNGWRVNSVASAVTASNPSMMRIYAILER